MQARVKWVEGLTFLGESASGHQVLMDGNAGDKAPSPMEMLLMSAGGCSAIDVVSILQKGRNDVHNCEVKLTSERREEAPRLFTAHQPAFHCQRQRFDRQSGRARRGAVR
ncbi:OsmC-like protein [Ewingella americana]|uniref:OsmC-like protein n=1 Tax=Ewingella americana TaxID=41202 RepID=A0A377N6J2_9GAMM|nr:OsmC-like protein [Ewingella americana]